MSNPLVHNNVVMTIQTPIVENRYLHIPYFPKGDFYTNRIYAFLPPFEIDDFHCLEVDRRGLIYNLGVYFPIIFAIQQPSWYSIHSSGFGLAAYAVAQVTSMVGIITFSMILAEWVQRRKL